MCATLCAEGEEEGGGTMENRTSLGSEVLSAPLSASALSARDGGAAGMAIQGTASGALSKPPCCSSLPSLPVLMLCRNWRCGNSSLTGCSTRINWKGGCCVSCERMSCHGRFWDGCSTYGPHHFLLMVQKIGDLLKGLRRVNRIWLFNEHDSARNLLPRQFHLCIPR